MFCQFLLCMLVCCVFCGDGLRVASSTSKSGVAGNKPEAARPASETLAPARSKPLEPALARSQPLEPDAESKLKQELASVRDAIRLGLSPYGSKEWRAGHRVMIGVECQGASMQIAVGGSTIVSVHKKSPKTCSVFCDETVGCVAWSWNKDHVNKNCHAHRSCLQRCPKSNMVSGMKATFAATWYLKSIADRNDFSFDKPEAFEILVDRAGEVIWSDGPEQSKLEMVGGFTHDRHMDSVGWLMFGRGGLVLNEELEAKVKDVRHEGGTVRLRLADGKILVKVRFADRVRYFVAEKKQVLFQIFDRVTVEQDQVIAASDVQLWKNSTENQPFILKRGDGGTVGNPYHPHKTGVLFDRDPDKTVWVKDTLLVKSDILKEVQEDEVRGTLGSLGDVLIHAIQDPITLEILRDPVMLSDSYTYERSFMEQFISRAEASGETPMSPLTDQPLSSGNLSSNYAIRSLVSSVIEKIDAARLKEINADATRGVLGRIRSLVSSVIGKVDAARLKEVNEDAVRGVLGSLGDVLIHAIQDPITLEILRDPIMASDSFTYERSAMEQSIARAEGSGETPKSPLTNEPLSSVKLSSNYAIRSLVSSVIEKVDAARTAAAKIQKHFRGSRLRKAVLGRENVPVAWSTASSVVGQEIPSSRYLQLLRSIIRALRQWQRQRRPESREHPKNDQEA